MQANIVAAMQRHLATCSWPAVCEDRWLYLFFLPMTGTVDDDGQLLSTAESYQYTNGNINPFISYHWSVWLNHGKIKYSQLKCDVQKTSRFIFVNLKLKHAHICCYDAHGNYDAPVLECEIWKQSSWLSSFGKQSNISLLLYSATHCLQQCNVKALELL